MNTYKIILLIGTIQGFLLTISLLIRNYNKKKQNYFFLVLVTIFSCLLFAKLNFNDEDYLKNPYIWHVADLIPFCIGPLWFFTIQKSIQPKVKIYMKDIWALSPAFLQILILVYMLNLSTEDITQRSKYWWYLPAFYFFCLRLLFVNAYFLWRTHLLLKNYQDTKFPALLIKGQYAFLGIILVWLISFVSSFFIGSGFSLNLQAYDIAFISFAFLTFALAALAIIKPESFYFLNTTYDLSENYVLQQVANKVIAYIEEKDAFRNPNFTLNQLAEEIVSNPVITSKAINRILKKSYSDLMNAYRVKYFLRLAQQEKLKNLTLWAIAQEAGFGNKVSFHKAFKKECGTTPKSYLSKLENG